jgi:adenylate kinase family enzyme
VSLSSHIAVIAAAAAAAAVLQYNLVHISVGDLLREQVQQGTPAGADTAYS